MMDTATAAAQAGVTVATIRAWCRIGAIVACKKAGRWCIDAASLAYRISLGVRKPRRKKTAFSVETMTAIGGKRWTKNGFDRVYFDNWPELMGLEIGRYNTGNIQWAYLSGEKISNSEAYRLLAAVDKVYYDTADGKVHIRWG